MSKPLVWLAPFALILAACQAETPIGTVAPGSPTAVPTASVEVSGESTALSCVPRAMIGAYSRERTAADTDDSTLYGDWTLTIDPCGYLIAVDGIEQGAGRLELVEGDSEEGRLAVSQDLGCPNEFVGEAFYDFTVQGSTLTIEEAIRGTDDCQGRAAALGGSPGWSR